MKLPQYCGMRCVVGFTTLVSALAVTPWLLPHQFGTAHAETFQVNPVQVNPQPTGSPVSPRTATEIARAHLNSQGRSAVTIRKMATVNGFALGSWQQGEMGGNILLQKRNQTWVVLTSGGGWLGLKGLLANRVPRSTAEQLLNQIDPNWRRYE